MSVSPQLDKPCKLCPEQHTRAICRLHQATLYCCPQCDLHFIDYLDATPTNQETEHSLSDTARQYIAQRQEEGSYYHPLRLALLTKHIGLNNASLLDIGAGIGQFQQLVTQKTNCQTYGIEPSPLRRQYAQEQFNLELYSQYVTDPFWQTSYSETFTAITLWDVLEHVNDPYVTLYYAARLLAPGGIIAFETPNRETISYRISEIISRLTKGHCSLFLDNFYAAIPFGHKQIFTTSQLAELASACELKIIDCHYSYTPSFFRNNKIILVMQKPLKS